MSELWKRTAALPCIHERTAGICCLQQHAEVGSRNFVSDGEQNIRDEVVQERRNKKHLEQPRCFLLKRYFRFFEAFRFAGLRLAAFRAGLRLAAFFFFAIVFVQEHVVTG